MAELDSIFEQTIDTAQDEYQRALDEGFESARSVFDALFSIGSYLPSLRYPGVPRIFGVLIDTGLGAIQTFVGRVLQIPGRVMLGFATAAFTVPKHFHNRVMPLDDAIRLSIKLLIDQGLTTAAGAGVPPGIIIKKKVSGWIDTWVLLRYLNLSAGLRLIKGKIVTLILHAVALIFFYLGVIFFGVLIYKLWKFANDQSNDKFFTKQTLFQGHPMIKDRNLGRKRLRYVKL